MKNILIFASGSGSNAETIINHFQHYTEVCVVGIFTNKLDAGVIERARKYNIPSEVFSKTEFSEESFLEKVNSYNPVLIVLAGFILKVPDYIITAFPDKIVNIHPALLTNNRV